LVLTLGGCGERKKRTATSKTPSSAPVQTFDPGSRASELKAKEIVTYQGERMRDPFESVVAARRAEEDSRKKAWRGTSPLQKYDVQSYKLIAIIEKSDGNVAMLIAPDGKGYMVQEGMPLGMNDGRISRILSDVVEVAEVRRDHLGNEEKKIIPLTLPKPKEAEMETWDYTGNEGE